MVLTASSWPLWFVRLSGWPVFLAVVVFVYLFAAGLSIALATVAHRSVLQNAVLAAAIVTLVGFVVFGTLALASGLVA